MSIESQVEALILESIREINEQLPENARIEPSRETRIFGEVGGFDSLALVNLIVNVEQRIQANFDVKVTLADEKALSQRNSPFRSVDSLANYIQLLLQEQAHE